MTEKISEKSIHQAFEKWMRERNIIFITCRMDRASTIAKGMPDYLVVHEGRCVFIEVKTTIGKISVAQQDMFIRIKANQTPCAVTRSVEECCQVVRHYLFDKPPYASREEAASPLPESLPEPEGTVLGIASWMGVDYVFIQERNPKKKSTGIMLRKATQYDMLHLSRI